MKKYLIVLLLSSNFAFSQDFKLIVENSKNTCTNDDYHSNNLIVVIASLSTKTIEIYGIARLEPDKKNMFDFYNVIESSVNNDINNGIVYTYKISSYKNGKGVLIYVPREKFIKLTLDENSCGYLIDVQ